MFWSLSLTSSLINGIVAVMNHQKVLHKFSNSKYRKTAIAIASIQRLIYCHQH